jgi:hypothetical protein
MYGELTIDSVRMNLLTTEAPHTSALDLIFETSDFDVKYFGRPRKRCVLRGEVKDGVIKGTMQIGKETRPITMVRDAMASIQRRIERSVLFGHWKWPWEQ